MLKFLGGEGSSFRLDQDSAGRFISQITVGYHDGDLVEFNNIPISMMIEIGTLEEEQRRVANIRHNKI